MKERDHEDRISKLSDDVIHQIMFFLDARLAVQTSVLSKRWKFVWTTLPFLDFNDDYFRKKYSSIKKYSSVYYKFLDHVFSRRNHQCHVLNLELYPKRLSLMRKYIKYAISHNVEYLNIQSSSSCSLSLFSSISLKKLELAINFKYDCWSLPNLTHLILKYSDHTSWYTAHKILKSSFTCLSALTTLDLERFELPEFFSLPTLTTLCLKSCILPRKVWHLPALLSLELVNVFFPENMIDYFLALPNLRDLAIDFGKNNKIGHYAICCSQLLNLKIRAPFIDFSTDKKKFEVSAPKLCNFYAIGFFPITVQNCDLKNVEIKFWDSAVMNYKSMASEWSRLLKQFVDLFKNMSSQLGSAKILTLDWETLQVLSEISDIFIDLQSPYCNLKYLKLPDRCKESSISWSLRQYLLGGSPSATICK